MSLSSSAWRVAITSGKGGVGKTSVTVHLATALAEQGLRVGVVDADLALGNIDVMLGLSPRWHLGHVIAGERTLDDVLLDGPCGIRIAPAGSGVRSLTSLDAVQWARLSHAIDDFADRVDVLLLDTATGIGDTVLDMVALADCTLVVTTFEPAALVDAYALVKLVDALGDTRDIGVLVNATRRVTDADTAFRQLSLVSERFLGRTLRDAGAIVHDPEVQAAAQATRILNAPASAARRGFRELARRLSTWSTGACAIHRDMARVRPPRVADLAARLVTEAAPCA
jgi:flagellar biosynthesis protein FlhG